MAPTAGLLYLILIVELYVFVGLFHEAVVNFLSVFLQVLKMSSGQVH